MVAFSLSAAPSPTFLLRKGRPCFGIPPLIRRTRHMIHTPRLKGILATHKERKVHTQLSAPREKFNHPTAQRA